MALLYPDLFNVKKTIPESTIYEINTTITDAIPEFKNLTLQPVHILTVKDSYFMQTKNSSTLKHIKCGNNQYLTGLACEYLFKQFNNTEIEQAYFLSPNKTIDEISATANEIKFERIRNQIAFKSNTISSFIKRTPGATPQSFREIWMLIWENFYKTNDVNRFRHEHNIKTSLIDYMSPLSLDIMNEMLQDIIVKYLGITNPNIGKLAQIAKNSALLAHNKFIKQNTSPTMQLLQKNSKNRIDRLNRARIKFWHEYYPKSL